MILPTKEFIEVFKKTNGALSVCESIAIMNIAAQAPEGLYMELGTHRGKSAMSALIGLKNEVFFAVDPMYEDEDISYEIEDVLLQINGTVAIEMISDISVNAIQKYDEYAYVFVDSGSHQDGLPLMEVKLLEDRMVQGGIIAFHDFRSQFIEVEAAYMYLLGTGKYEEIDINWREIIEYVKENDLEKGNLSWHHNELEFPCFVGALKRK